MILTFDTDNTGRAKAFREKPDVQIFAKRGAPLNRCTRSAFSCCLRLKAERFKLAKARF
jgi:hypothetical protein